MAKYRVSLHTVASQTVTVEAGDEDQAAELAYEEGTSSVCAQCSGWGQKWSLDLGDFEIDDDEEYGGVVYKGVELIDEG